MERIDMKFQEGSNHCHPLRPRAALMGLPNYTMHYIDDHTQYDRY